MAKRMPSIPTLKKASTTTYSYTAAGDLQGIDYSDTTPDVGMTYDRSGRPKTTADAAGSRTFTYDASGQLKDEDYTAGLLNGLGVHRGFDSLSRLNNLSALSASSAFNQVAYSYDAASRLDTVTQGTNTATYGYVPNSSLVQTVTFAQGGTTRLTTTKAYDNLNRLYSTSSAPSASSALSTAYTYNSANQRTKATREDSAYWSYGYDALGQVTTGKKFDLTDAALPGRDFAWTFDDIGNRKSATVNSQISNYSANSLNQYTQRTIPGAVDVSGAAAATATVTVSLNSGAPQATARSGELFFKQLTVDNSAAAQNPSIKITGVKNLVGANGEDAVTEVPKTAFLPQSPESFTHDADGNLTDDARWHYTWDGENRLIAMETQVGAVAPNGPLPATARQKLEFAYDGQGRRIDKKVYAWNLSTLSYQLSTETKFLYDGWNLLADLNALNSNAVVCTYVWGLDLSGSLQGAGGVGGLLFSTFENLDPSTQTLTLGAHAPAFDGNGNVIGLVDMATGVKSATYDYNAFGETIQSDGVASVTNHFRFSTKYQDDETGLLYYGYRFYQPNTGRWLSRDPLGELAGNNRYASCANDLVSRLDFLGLADCCKEGQVKIVDFGTAKVAMGTSELDPEGRIEAFGKGVEALESGLNALDLFGSAATAGKAGVGLLNKGAAAVDELQELAADIGLRAGEKLGDMASAASASEGYGGITRRVGTAVTRAVRRTKASNYYTTIRFVRCETHWFTSNNWSKESEIDSMIISTGGDLGGAVFLNNTPSSEGWQNAFREHLERFRSQYGPDNVKY